MEKKENAPFHETEYGVLKELVGLQNYGWLAQSITMGHCKRMYEELQSFYESQGIKRIFAVPIAKPSGMLGLYTQNLYDAYNHGYLPSDLARKIHKQVHGCCFKLPRVLDEYNISCMSVGLRELLKDYIVQFYAGQVILSTEICELRDSSWEECFDDWCIDTLLVVNI